MDTEMRIATDFPYGSSAAGFLRFFLPRVLLGALVFAGIACGRTDSGSPASSRAGVSRRSSRAGGSAASLVTKEEVSAILGVPVTALEPSGEASVTYKTADPMMYATLEVERKDGAEDAERAMAGARKATGFLGGTPQPAAGLGDDAFFGAMSVLYVRKGSVVLNIAPPNLLQVAQGQAYNKVIAAGTDADAAKSAMDNLAAISKGDPNLAGNSERDPMKAATDVVAASSKPQGTEYEAKARTMAAGIARAALARL